MGCTLDFLPGLLFCSTIRSHLFICYLCRIWQDFLGKVEFLKWKPFESCISMTQNMLNQTRDRLNPLSLAKRVSYTVPNNYWSKDWRQVCIDWPGSDLLVAGYEITVHVFADFPPFDILHCRWHKFQTVLSTNLPTVWWHKNRTGQSLWKVLYGFYSSLCTFYEFEELFSSFSQNCIKHQVADTLYLADSYQSLWNVLSRIL